MLESLHLLMDIIYYCLVLEILNGSAVSNVYLDSVYEITMLLVGFLPILTSIIIYLHIYRFGMNRG